MLFTPFLAPLAYVLRKVEEWAWPFLEPHWQAAAAGSGGYKW